MAYSEQQDIRPGRFELQSVSRGAAHFLVLRGELDADACPEVERELLRIESHVGELIVLDLSELDFIDSTGIALLVGALRRSKQDSERLRFVPSRSEDVQRLLEICGLDGHLPLID